MPQLLIADISEYQTLADADTYAKWSPAITLRAHNGSREDNHYPDARAKVQAAVGIRFVMHYGYCQAGLDAHQQGVALGQTIKNRGGLPKGHTVGVDLEEGTGDQTARADTYLQGVHTVLGEPGSEDFGYSGENFWKQHLGTVTAADGTPVHRWIAAYGPNTPGIGETLWQFTDRQTVPGVTGSCDCSTFNGTIDQLLNLVNPPGGAIVANPAGRLAAPIVAAITRPQNDGGWLIGADGGTFPWGKAVNHGNPAGIHLAAPIVAAVAAADGAGYTLIGSDGGTFRYGTGPDIGSLAA